MKKWEIFKNEYLGKISRVISWIVNIAGLVFAILSFINSSADLGWIIILGIVIFNSVFLIMVSIYETLLYKRAKTIENKITTEKDDEISKLTLSIKISDDLSDKLRYYYKYIIMTLNKFNTQLFAVNGKLAKSRDETKVLKEKKCLNGKEVDNDVMEYIESVLKTAEDDYCRSMLREYNHFLGNVTGKLKFILDACLKSKNCMLETSISIKQFDRIVVDPNDINDVIVITTFRDSQTYSLGKREIGQKEYSISKNTDFIYCLSHSYFLKNNITSDDKSYDNENTGFLEYYNCTIVVPIKYSYPDCSHIYGYLTCDILNDDLSKENLLDEDMAEIMEATANIIGAYFDNMDYNWEYTFENDFLDIVFDMKTGD